MFKKKSDEGSAVDMAQDTRDAKRAGKTQAEYEGSPADEKKDAARMRPNNPHGNASFHPSTKGFDHSGPTHTSKDR